MSKHNYIHSSVNSFLLNNFQIQRYIIIMSVCQPYFLTAKFNFFLAVKR